MSHSVMSGDAQPATSSGPVLFVSSVSSPSRAVWMLAKQVHPSLRVVEVDQGEHMPDHPARVPCFRDDANYSPPLVLYEGHAILRYLARGTPFYPDDLTACAIIDNVLVSVDDRQQTSLVN